MKSDTSIGKLPAEWQVRPLGELLTLAQYGLSVRGNGQGSYPLLRMTNQVGGRIVARDLQFADIGSADLVKFRVESGDLLFNRTNSFDLVGRTAIFELKGDFVFASYLIRLRTSAKQLNPHFLNFYLNGDETQRRLKSIATRAVSQSNISATRLKTFPIPVPPLDEQCQIARVLSAVQCAIEQQERLIALTAELKNALMHKLFTEGIRGEPLKQTEIGLVPENWLLVEIGTLGKCVTGTTPSTKVVDYYTPDEYCFVSPADLGDWKYATKTAKMISERGLRVARELPRDSILCVCIGSSIGKTGMTYQQRSCTNQQINAVVANASSNPQFVYYLLTFWSEHWRNHATFGPIPILNKGAFEKVQVPFTSDRDEQDRIADVLSAVDEKVEHHIKHRDSIAALFRTLLHQLMTAQVRVHDLDLSALDELVVEIAEVR